MNKSKRAQKSIFQTLCLILLMLVITSACHVKTEASASGGESELIKRVNAVQEQMMVQGNISEEERQAILALASLVGGGDSRTNSADLADAIEFDEVDKTPMYPGCEGKMAAATKACFMDQINQLVEKEFDKGIAQGLGIEQEQSVEVIFRITETGEMQNLKVRDAPVRIQSEAARVLRLLPPMKPAVHQGQKVSVMCMVVIPYGG